ncbi:protein-disulfide reductase DsbD family protein [Simiduia agarivorans]|nr:protein-disulfide reductase DsbD [Simiduia agarivorans]
MNDTIPMLALITRTIHRGAQCAKSHPLAPVSILLTLLLTLAMAPAQAQFTTDGLGSEPEFLPVEEAYQAVPLVTGQQLSLEWRISPGYYLYRERFNLQAAQGGQTIPLSTQWPAGKHKYDEYFEKELEVYYSGVMLELAGALDLTQDFELLTQSQGCADAGLCYPPRNQRFLFDASTGQFTEVAVQLPVAAESAPAASIPTPAPEGSWAFALLAALLGGAILNLMPCVFPVLSIKALSLAASGEDARHRQMHGWAYTLGVVLSFVAIAAALLLVRAGGEAVGWGFQLQTPGLILALVYLFFILGLALLGAIEIGSGLANLGSGLASKGGLKGSFFTGGLATLVASPCTAPFMGTALGYAMTQPAYVSLTVFAALGTGMALPFLALCYLPNLHQWLPKPGAWMETFKEILAFPLLLTAIWLLWVLGRQTSTDQLALALCGLVALGFALWAWKRRHWLGRAFAVAAVASAVILPLADADSPDIWTAYDKDSFSQLRQSGQPLFVNVTADWCLTCLANEKLVFSQQDVMIEVADADLLLVKADWTKYNADITALLAQYQRNGVPLYLMFPADPAAKPEILPQLLTPEIFTDALYRAIETN